jgi:hypothetical protein
MAPAVPIRLVQQVGCRLALQESSQRDGPQVFGDLQIWPHHRLSLDEGVCAGRCPLDQCLLDDLSQVCDSIAWMYDQMPRSKLWDTKGEMYVVSIMIPIYPSTLQDTKQKSIHRTGGVVREEKGSG